MFEGRIEIINKEKFRNGPVVYWMSRDQRVFNNWALLFAQHEALKHKQPLAVVFCLSENFLNAGEEQYAFMLKGLIEVFKKLKRHSIPGYIVEGDPGEKIPGFLKNINAGMAVTDFNPLRISRDWLTKAAAGSKCPFFQVDARNIVPCREVSDKQEYAAYTLRPKWNKLKGKYLGEFPSLQVHPYRLLDKADKLYSGIETLEKICRIKHFSKKIISGEDYASQIWKEFLDKKIRKYGLHNDPNSGFTSGLSPYLHFGQISSQKILLDIYNKGIPAEDFIEEITVRRELADNFCWHNKNYDNSGCFPEWAKKTLEEHADDRREYIYRIDDFMNAKTHDRLWNAAQMQMVKTGYMHGYMRMYWGKKILEWSENYQEAMETAVYLNDRFELDGRDSNGYAGIAWCIGGVHDRAWGERNIFGEIRYMSYEGCKRKFDTEKYIEMVENQ